MPQQFMTQGAGIVTVAKGQVPVISRSVCAEETVPMVVNFLRATSPGVQVILNDADGSSDDYRADLVSRLRELERPGEQFQFSGDGRILYVTLQRPGANF